MVHLQPFTSHCFCGSPVRPLSLVSLELTGLSQKCVWFLCLELPILLPCLKVISDVRSTSPRHTVPAKESHGSIPARTTLHTRRPGASAFLLDTNALFHPARPEEFALVFPGETDGAVDQLGQVLEHHHLDLRTGCGVLCSDLIGIGQIQMFLQQIDQFLVGAASRSRLCW